MCVLCDSYIGDSDICIDYITKNDVLSLFLIELFNCTISMYNQSTRLKQLMKNIYEPMMILTKTPTSSVDTMTLGTCLWCHETDEGVDWHFSHFWLIVNCCLFSSLLCLLYISYVLISGWIYLESLTLRLSHEHTIGQDARQFFYVLDTAPDTIPLFKNNGLNLPRTPALLIASSTVQYSYTNNKWLVGKAWK